MPLRSFLQSFSRFWVMRLGIYCLNIKFGLKWIINDNVVKNVDMALISRKV